MARGVINGVDMTANVISALLLGLTLFVLIFTVKATSIILGAILLLLVGLSFSFFAYDVLTKIGNRNSISIIIFVFTHFISAIALFGDLARWTGLRYTVNSLEDKHSFWGAMYFSTVTWTTVGYGDIVPGPNTRALATFESLLGYVAMALLIAIFSAIFQSWRQLPQ